MRKMIALLVPLVLVGAACGDDDDEPSTGTEAPPATDAPPPTDAPPATDAGEPAATDPASTDAPPSDGVDAVGPIPTGDSGSAWCLAAADVQAGFDDLEVTGFDDPARLESTYREVRVRIGEAARVAPPGLDDAVTTTVNGIDILIDELDSVGWSFLDLDLSVLSDLEAELDAAGNAIDRYNFYVCNIDNGYDPDDVLADADDEPTFDEDGTIREQTIGSLVDSGFTREEAECLVDRIDRIATEREAVYEECGISLERLLVLDGG